MKMHTKLLGSVALSAMLAVSFTGCGSDSSSAPATTTVSPYQRVAVITGDWTGVDAVAEKIAQYVVNTNEATDLGFKTNWVIAGANTGAAIPETYELADLLPIPVVTDDIGTTEKSRVIEFCNKAYATEAIATGRFHGSALPCEVSVHSDGTNIFVDMLDAEAIFNIFFTIT